MGEKTMEQEGEGARHKLGHKRGRYRVKTEALIDSICRG